MNERAVTIATTILGVLGILLVLAVAFFELGRRAENIMLFAGVACFIIAGAIKGMVKRRNRQKKGGWIK